MSAEIDILFTSKNAYGIVETKFHAREIDLLNQLGKQVKAVKDNYPAKERIYVGVVSVKPISEQLSRKLREMNVTCLEVKNELVTKYQGREINEKAFISMGQTKGMSM